MEKESHLEEGTENGLFQTIIYEGGQSPEFDALARSRERTYARMKSQSEPTKTKLVISEWHVPCHCILTQTKEGVTQAFHVQPNQPTYTLLSSEQEKTLCEIGGLKTSKAIVAISHRSRYCSADRKELQKFGFAETREISIDTDQWWRILYDPSTNEIWIDDKIHHTLLKYHGFSEQEKNHPTVPTLPIDTTRLRDLLS